MSDIDIGYNLPYYLEAIAKELKGIEPNSYWDTWLMTLNILRANNPAFDKESGSTKDQVRKELERLCTIDKTVRTLTLKPDDRDVSEKLEKIEAVTNRAASDRSYDGNLIDDIRDIIDGREKITLVVPQGPHPSHKLYVSDSSLYDYKCEGCHNTDVTGGGWGRLAEPCPVYPDED